MQHFHKGLPQRDRWVRIGNEAGNQLRRAVALCKPAVHKAEILVRKHFGLSVKDFHSPNMKRSVIRRSYLQQFVGTEHGATWRGEGLKDKYAGV